MKHKCHETVGAHNFKLLDSYGVTDVDVVISFGTIKGIRRINSQVEESSVGKAIIKIKNYFLIKSFLHKGSYGAMNLWNYMFMEKINCRRRMLLMYLIH